MPKAVPSAKKMRLLPLIAATYFMVSGGPYGLEDIIGMAGFGRALLLLAIVPLLWSLPTALMVGELASAIPAEGGFYVWVRRALGGFWGFQEAWLSLAASIFDMAIYPTTFTLYLGHVFPSLVAGYRGFALKLAIVLIATLWNLRGAVAVGRGSIRMMIVSLSPFVVLLAVALWRILHGGVHIAGASELTTRDLGGAPQCRPLELHGMGQRQHHRPGGRRSAAQLSSCDVRLRHSGHARLHAAACRHVGCRHSCRALLHRSLGRRCRASRRLMACLRRRARRFARRPSAPSTPSPSLSPVCPTPWPKTACSPACCAAAPPGESRGSASCSVPSPGPSRSISPSSGSSPSTSFSTEPRCCWSSSPSPSCAAVSRICRGPFVFPEASGELSSSASVPRSSFSSLCGPPAPSVSPECLPFSSPLW